MGSCFGGGSTLDWLFRISDKECMMLLMVEILHDPIYTTLIIPRVLMCKVKQDVYHQPYLPRGGMML